jgi:hypothetical protein
MHIYAVFLPSGLSPLRAAEKAVLVRQGFSWSAFLLTPVWALRHGLWLAFALWLFGLFLIASMSVLAHMEPLGALAIYGLGALAFGLEADRFRQANLSRSGFLLRGLALGESKCEAESLYFARRADLTTAQAPVAPARSAAIGEDRARFAESNSAADLLGLFPQQETKR